MAAQQPFVMTPKSILFHQELSPTTKLFYSVLLHYDRGRGCWASRETLSKMTGLSLYYIRESIKELIEFGLITETRRGQGRTNVINIVSDEPVADDGDDELVSSLEVKPVVPIQYEEETKERDIERAPDSFVDGHAQTDASNDHAEQIRIHKDDTDQFLQQITDPHKPNLEKIFQGAHIIDSDSTQNTILVTSEPVRDFIQKFYKSKIEQIIGKEIRIVGS